MGRLGSRVRVSASFLIFASVILLLREGYLRGGGVSLVGFSPRIEYVQPYLTGKGPEWTGMGTATCLPT